MCQKRRPPKFIYQYLAFGYHATKNQLCKLSLSSSSVVSVDFTYFKLIRKKYLDICKKCKNEIAQELGLF